MDKKMTSGEIAKKAGVSQKAVRLYDEKGLLKPTDYSEGNYRLYDKESLVILEKIVALKQIGFSLEEIRDNLQSGAVQDIEEALQKQLKIMEDKRYQIDKVIGVLRGTLERKTGKLDWDSVAEIVQCISLDQEADENHWDALKHTSEEQDWYVTIYKSLPIKEKEKILDLGCGYAKLWRNNWEDIPQGVKISAYDLHGTWADDFANFIPKHEKELAENVSIDLQFMDIEKEDTWEIISKNQKYSMIIAHYLWDEIRDFEKLLRRVGQVLAKDGILSVTGYGISCWNYFFRGIFSELGLDTVFIDEVIQVQTQEKDAGKALLDQYFTSVEEVDLPNVWHYTEGSELFDKLLKMYPEKSKYLLVKEEKIKAYLEKKIQEDGEIMVNTKSTFWHCKL